MPHPVYRNVREQPRRNRHVGRNRANGYAYRILEGGPEEKRDLSRYGCRRDGDSKMYFISLYCFLSVQYLNYISVSMIKNT